MPISIRVLAVATMALVTSGCATSPPARFFTLQTLEIEPAQKTGSTLLLGLGPIVMPDYVQRPQMVMRMPGNELVVQEFVRWAEPLENAVVRILARNVDALTPGMIVVAFPYQGVISADYRLVGRIDQFDTDRSGTATLSIQWGMRKGEQIVLAPRRDRFTAQADNPDDPAARVAALNDTLDQLSRAMAQVIGDIPATTQP